MIVDCRRRNVGACYRPITLDVPTNKREYPSSDGMDGIVAVPLNVVVIIKTKIQWHIVIREINSGMVDTP